MTSPCQHEVSVRISPPDKDGVQHKQCGECLADLGTAD